MWMVRDSGDPPGKPRERGKLTKALREQTMARLLRSLESPTVLGPREGWPASLETVLGLLLESPSPMFVLWGPECVWFSNDAFLPLLGPDAGNPLTRPGRLVWPDFWDRLGPDAEALLSDDQPFRLDDQDLRAVQAEAGAFTWQTISCVPIRDGGQRVGWLGTLLEGPCQEKEAWWRRSEERFRLAADAVNGIIQDHDLQTGIVLRTRGLFEVLGYHPEEVPSTGAWWRQQIHPEDLAAADTALEAAIAAGADRAVAAYRLRHRDGHWLRVLDRSILVRDAAGRVSRLVSCTINVTERKQMLEALAEREALYRTLTDAMPQIVTSAGPDGRMDQGNRRWYEYTGTRPDPDQGLAWEDAVHPEDRARVLELWVRSLETGAPFEVECRYRRADGVYRWHLSRALPVHNERGGTIKWVATATDIDDFKRAEEALKEADRRKDEFLATLAHELRNPLAPVCNTLFLLRQACGSLSAVQQSLDMMERQVNHMVRLLDDLLDLSRITRGRIQVRKQRIDLSAVVSLAVETVRPAIEAGRHALTVSLPPGPLILDADPTRLAQVLANLLDNAARYTNPGGRISFLVERAGDQIVLRVRDTGVGIPEAMLTRVFEMFTQVDRSQERTQAGLGIGLTLVQRLVHKHGGTVEARSPGPGQGSEFVVRLPLPAVAECRHGGVQKLEKTADSPREPPPSQGRRILLADDNRDAADSLALLLQVSGHETCLAYDGQEALDKAQAWRPDVALLDIGMPKLTGHEVARRLRAQPEFQALFLVALTGWGQEDDRRRSREAGFDHHLVKPCDMEVLQSLLTSMVISH